MNILLIEDEESLLVEMANNLKREKFRVFPTTSGKQAGDILKRESFDAIVLDVSISDVDGWQLCREIKNNRKYSSISIIILYLASKNDEKEFKELGLKYALKRPDDFEGLFKILKDLSFAPPIKPVKKHKISILVVEDDKMILNIVKSLFELEGYKVFTAVNPYKAFSILEKEDYKIDLIISDVAMPKMDGVTFFLKLKEKEEGKDIPFIMLTAKDQFEDIKVAYEIGVKEYIAKPFDPLDLMAKVEEFLSLERNKYFNRDL